MSTIEASPSDLKSPVGVISTDIIEQLSPYVPIGTQPKREKRRRATRRRLRFRTKAQRNALSGNARALLTSLSLIVTDLVTIVIAYAISHLVAGLIFGPTVQAIVPTLGFAIMCVSYGAIALIQGLYPGTALSPVFEFRQVVVSVLLASLLATFFVFSFHTESLHSVTIFLLTGALLAVWLPLVRAFARHGWAKFGWWGERVIIIGTGPQAKAIYEFYNHSPHRGLKPIGYVDEPSMTDGNSPALPPLRLGPSPAWPR